MALEEFKPLNLTCLSFDSPEEEKKNIYLVYKDAIEFSEVNAITASEAIEKSGIEKPYKVVYSLPQDEKILADGKLFPVATEQAMSGEDTEVTAPEEEVETEQPT